MYKKQNLLEKQFGNHFLKKKKKKVFPILIFLGMSLEHTHICFRPYWKIYEMALWKG